MAGFYIISGDDDFARKVFMEPQKSVDAALAEAYNRLGKDAKVIVMPYGASTLPCME